MGILYEDDEVIYFAYSPQWLANGFSISPRSLSLRPSVFHCQSTYFHGLFGVFADSLPDGWGTRLATKKLAKRGIHYPSLSHWKKHIN